MIMMKPIHKIPMMDSEFTLAQIVNMELIDDGNGFFTQNVLTDLIDHDETDGFDVMMDWAMQIRSELGIGWGESLRAASVLYYG